MPILVYDLVQKIPEHPLWELYILPAVLGLAIRMRYENADPLELFDGYVCIYGLHVYTSTYSCSADALSTRSY
jgi:hypothetical protein